MFAMHVQHSRGSLHYMNIIAVKKPSRKDREKAEEKEPEDPEAIESKRLRVERFLKILVVGSLKDVPSHADLCGSFVSRLGELIVERDHSLITGCRGSLDKAIAEAAHKPLRRCIKTAACSLLDID